ncbi:hypothetical protein SynA1560_01573 [Synechococcus sp. A15-60]|nr:hypothetical protein SynA1560_01573 [Synechococcus sp. A15-60]
MEGCPRPADGLRQTLHNRVRQPLSGGSSAPMARRQQRDQVDAGAHDIRG